MKCTFSLQYTIIILFSLERKKVQPSSAKKNRPNVLLNLQAADQENEQRRRLEAAAAEALNASEEVIKRNKLNQKKQQVCRIAVRALHAWIRIAI